MRPRSILIVRNPRAGHAPSEAALEHAAVPLRDAGTPVEIRATMGPGNAKEVAAEAARDGIDVVVAVGGDGTINEVVNGLAGSTTALATIPAGTANVWSKEVGVPRRPERALEWLGAARRARVDLGRATLGDGSDRFFLLMCSTGIDAEIVRRVEGSSMKRRLGRVWYGLVSAERGLRAPTVRTRITVDSKTIERDLLFAVAGNTRLYGGLVRLASDARADDGLLDLVAFSGGGLANRARLTARALRGHLDRRTGSGIEYLRGAEMRIEPAIPLAVQADGEYLGETPLTLSVAPAAIDVLIGPGPNPLLSS